MFARTPRLLLRPAFPEDRAMLARTLADEIVVRQLANAQWPFGEAEADRYLADPADPALPRCLVYLRTDGAPELVGGVGLSRLPSGSVELGYWIARARWNQGIATEAASAVIAMARALRLPRIEASHFTDNDASARVLQKLGFVASGLTAPRYSCARGQDAMARLYRLSLASADAEVRVAA